MVAKKIQSKLEKVFRGMVYVLPAVLFFSYWPLITLGSDETMNFELSLPLIWLVLFDLLVIGMMLKQKIFWRGLKNKWMWLLFPIFLSLSVIWSLNPVRGVLTVGILWLIYVAVYGFWNLKDLFKEVNFKEKFWKVFFGSTLFVCGWCWLQCILDLLGVSQDYSLMCAGCVYEMFGFPRVNGFAAEPQFMGNLLLAPLIISGYFGLKNKKYLWLFFIFAATLFLTMSRGAIYAFVVAMVIMTIVMIVRTKKAKIFILWPVILLSFIFALNMQGVMAQVSKTDDIYMTGINKVINQLSLGMIDFGNKNNSEVVPVNNDESIETEEKEKAHFDGYVAASTDSRLGFSGEALGIWAKDFKTAMLGIGIGGTTKALSMSEIVNNEYVAILLETGLVGAMLFILTLVLIVRAFWKNPLRLVLLTLVIAYGVSLCFFSGLPNALHIYLLPGLVYSIGLRKKLVS